MGKYKAVLFDLDDTLLKRDKAVDYLFRFILENYYTVTDDIMTKKMLKRFKEYDKQSYGDGDKSKVLKPFFQEFPPEREMTDSSMADFWNKYFPQCFKVGEDTLVLLNQMNKYVKMGIITNGSVQRQNAKIKNSKLNSYFETIIISEEVGLSKPDKKIFDLALDELDVVPEDVLFIGDDLVKDVKGPQNAGMTAVWFNPMKEENTTDITPDLEVNHLDNVLALLI